MGVLVQGFHPIQENGLGWKVMSAVPLIGGAISFAAQESLQQQIEQTKGMEGPDRPIVERIVELIRMKNQYKNMDGKRSAYTVIFIVVMIANNFFNPVFGGILAVLFLFGMTLTHKQLSHNEELIQSALRDGNRRIFYNTAVQ